MGVIIEESPSANNMISYLLIFDCHRKLGYITLGKDEMELIWHPRLSFHKLHSVEKMSGLGYDKWIEYYLNDPNMKGINLEMNELMKITIACDFKFHLYPMDNQICDLSLYDPINPINLLVINEIKALCHNGKECSDLRNTYYFPNQPELPYKIGLKSIGMLNYTWESVESYTYPYSTIRFTFERNSLGLLVGSFYLPTGLFAILSMASYIINPDIVSS